MVLWLCGQLRGRVTLFVVVAAATILLLTHTRTALVGMVAGILVAGLSLFVAKARVRKLFADRWRRGGDRDHTLSSVMTTWLARGESTQQLTDLSGRTHGLEALLNFPRDKFQEIFGFGLSNSSFNGLPIDSNWLASYQEQGLFGVVICAMMLLFLLVTAYFQPRGVQRALALFLVTYCLVASFTEVGFTDASTYLLELTLAASLLVPSAAGRRPGMRIVLGHNRCRSAAQAERTGSSTRKARRSRHSGMRSRGSSGTATGSGLGQGRRKGDHRQPFTWARPSTKQATSAKPIGKSA